MTIEPISVHVMDGAEARRLTERIRLTAVSVREGMEKLQRLVGEAQEGQAHVALGYKSWTAYLADVLGEEPLRLPREERRELVGWLAGEGMSTRAIAPIVGASIGTVHADRDEVFSSEHLVSAPSAPSPDVPPVTGLDGKTYPTTTPEQAEPRRTSRRPLADNARDTGQDLRKAADRLTRIANDDRLTRNKSEVAAHLRHHLTHAIEVCQDLNNKLQ